MERWWFSFQHAFASRVGIISISGISSCRALFYFFEMHFIVV